MTAIGIDTHKATLAACAIDELGRPIGEATFANDPAGHDAFIAWARSTAPEATVGIEGSSSFGAPLVRRLLGAGGRLQDEKDIELLVLRHQVKVLQRQVARPRLNRHDRVLLAAASRAMTKTSWSSFIVRPETLLRWHRELSGRSGHTGGRVTPAGRRSNSTSGTSSSASAGRTQRSQAGNASVGNVGNARPNPKGTGGSQGGEISAPTTRHTAVDGRPYPVAHRGSWPESRRSGISRPSGRYRSRVDSSGSSIESGSHRDRRG
jgi:hypothetical protein